MSATWVRAGVRAAVDVDRDRDVEVREALLELADQRLGAVLGVDDRELAELDAGAGHRVAPPVGQARGQADLLEVGGERGDVRGGHADDDQLLVRREASAWAPYRSTSSARPVSVVPSIRPTTGAAPM